LDFIKETEIKTGIIFYARAIATKTEKAVSIFKSTKKRVFCGVLLGAIEETNRASIYEVTDAMNSIGWFSGDQLIKHLGPEAAMKLRSQVQSEVDQRQKKSLMI
jgi:hypothetical protein